MDTSIPPHTPSPETLISYVNGFITELTSPEIALTHQESVKIMSFLEQNSKIFAHYADDSELRSSLEQLEGKIKEIAKDTKPKSSVGSIVAKIETALLNAEAKAIADKIMQYPPREQHMAFGQLRIPHDDSTLEGAARNFYNYIFGAKNRNQLKQIALALGEEDLNLKFLLIIEMFLAKRCNELNIKPALSLQPNIKEAERFFRRMGAVE